ncbi:DUF6000 family protein [Actinospica acidithermotolerans]|uniref:DUF6000 family protein n=1 Tax=Actinospica acidithermotolerans TaxID=2828514 RepID=UPI0035592847
MAEPNAGSSCRTSRPRQPPSHPRGSILFGGGWRERKTAWLITIAGQAEFRDQLGELLLASEVVYAGRGCRVTLARFQPEQDAQLLTTYLDKYLPRLDLRYDQGMALDALMRIDVTLRTEHAGRFLSPGGPWQNWIGVPPSPSNEEAQRSREFISQLCAFADEAAVLVRLDATDPGERR